MFISRTNYLIAFISGCLKCFCYGVSGECAAAELGVERIEHAEGWKVITNLHVYIIIDMFDETKIHAVAYFR